MERISKIIPRVLFLLLSRHIVPCTNCAGTGIMDWKFKCPACNGRGYYFTRKDD